MTPFAPRRPAAAAAVLLLLAGCGGADLGSGLVEPRPVQAGACWPEQGRAFTTGTEERPVTVVTLGSADDGVVLLPGSGHDYCEWVEQAERLVDRGYAVASFAWQFADTGLAVRAAAAALQDAGVQRYAMLGSSLGAAEALRTARELDPAPAGVVALSPSYVPPVEPGGRHYDGPVLVVASTHDSHITIATSRAAADADDAFVELSGTAHGAALLRREHRDAVQALVDDFLTEVLPR